MAAQASPELIEAVLARREQIWLRLVIGLGVALGVGALVGWGLSASWLCLWYAAQAGEFLCANRLRALTLRGDPALAGPGLFFISLTNLTFSLIALAALQTGDVWGTVCGGWVLAGGLLNAAATSRSSRSAFLASAGPSAVCCAVVPVTAWRQGAAPAELAAVVSGTVLLLVAAHVLRSVGLKGLAEARQASAAKSIFLANMSHELRTPLNGVLGMAQALARADLPETERERARIIQRSGEALLVLLNDILDLSKIEAGKLELEDGDVEFSELAGDLQACFGALCADKDVMLSVRLDQSAAGHWAGDPVRLRQVFSNLISNAVKFTERGRVDVVFSADAHGLRFQVDDTGPGIPPDRLARMFEKFTQADATISRKYGGTGLGLAICRDLVDLMGGRIDVASEVGVGSRFTVRLPLNRSVAAVQPAAASPPVLGAQLRVLVAEDHETNRAVLRILLEQVGVAAHLVSDGQEALAAWERDRWDLVLMDIQMPVMDGLTAVRELRRREAERGRARTPVVALTANAMAHQLEEYRASGMDAFVPKPFNLSQLVGVLHDIVGQSEIPPADAFAKAGAG